MRAEVAVVGGGPVGLLVAAELAAFGVDVVVLEARDVVWEQPRATTLHARAVQCLARRGRLPEEESGGLGGSSGGASDGSGGGSFTGGPSTAEFHFAGVPGLVITAPEGEPAPILKCPQAELERLFERQARAAGARVLRGHAVTRLVEGPDAVVVAAEGPAGPVSCTARYVVGADGARSVVRELAGIASDVWPATVSALAGQVRLVDPGALSPGWHRTPRGWIVARPDADGSLHLRTLDCAGAHGERGAAPTPQELEREVSRIAGRDIRLAEPRWLSRFSDFTRLARRFRAGRVLLAGDAAHVHFPIGGQGLSAGVLDAVNLGWKLALAVRGEAGAGLLESYERERRTAAGRVVECARAQLGLMRPGLEGEEVARVLGAVLAGGGDGVLAGMVSGQDTVYERWAGAAGSTGAEDAAGVGEGSFLGNVRLRVGGRGGRVWTDVIGVLRAGGPVLLVPEGSVPGVYEELVRPWGGVVRVVRVGAAAGVGVCGAVLVRPDGYVGWAEGAGAAGAAGSGGGLRDALGAFFGAGCGAGRGPCPCGGVGRGVCRRVPCPPAPSPDLGPRSRTPLPGARP
ncbi:FAD-dependent monooxygenase [Streptomyces sp. NPDC046985]|uniref:FAD-dependent monooxygenase n=1 Tax=Streptomyces sp. NPDC046985 TaxID=3155377 RepID=UPI0033FF6890